MYSFLLLLASVAILLFSNPENKIEAPSPLIVPPDRMKFFTFGYNESVADSLWLRVIQDFDICTEAGKSVRPVYKDKFPDKKQTAEATGDLPPKCRRGWVFHMIYAITDIAPKFKDPVLYGAPVLSVLVDDREGAAIIFERGKAAFPDDWRIFYQAAYHSLFEEKNNRKAAEELVQAGKLGAPQWVYSLASRLLEKEGQLEFARSVLQAQIQSNPDEKVKELFRRRLAEIESKIDNQ